MSSVALICQIVTDLSKAVSGEWRDNSWSRGNLSAVVGTATNRAAY
ncbi:MAG: hypothetical protein WAK20_07200 [Candidatus Acidiferrum sp.]